MINNYTTPKRNIIAGMDDLRNALAHGTNARLIRARNEDCQHPIRIKKHDRDFKNYEFSIGYKATRQQILDDKNLDEFVKYLTLNYHNCYGTPEAVEHYYTTGELSDNNFKGMGRSHLVKVADTVKFFEEQNFESGWHVERAKELRKQYLDLNTINDPEARKTDSYWWDFYRYKHGSQWATKSIKHKLWAVEVLGNNQPKPQTPVLVYVLNWITYPLKFIPRKSVLRMPEYTNYTFRIGSVTNGLSVEFQIPKKFGFK
jgi:hypothetical protein